MLLSSALDSVADADSWQTEQIGLVARITGAAADALVTALLLVQAPAVSAHEVTKARLVSLAAWLIIVAALELAALPRDAAQIIIAPFIVVILVGFAAVLSLLAADGHKASVTKAVQAG